MQRLRNRFQHVTIVMFPTTTYESVQDRHSGHDRVMNGFRQEGAKATFEMLPVNRDFGFVFASSNDMRKSAA